jgi:ribokinase
MISGSIFGLGTILVDHQVYMEHHPEADTKGEVHHDRYQVGGPVPTALCLLNQFGFRTTFQGQWTDDPFGQMIELDLLKNGINFVAPVAHPKSKTGFAHVWVESTTGRRTIAAYRGSHPIDDKHVAEDELKNHDALHLDGWSAPASIKAAGIIRKHGGKVFMDLGSPKPDLKDLLKSVQFLNCPASLLDRLFPDENPKKSVQKLLQLGPQEITVTHGANGAWHCTESGIIRRQAFAIDANDTSGAGDVFSGAMIYGTMQGWEPAVKLEFACAAAALKCRKQGNRDALPTLEEVRSFLEENH